MNIRLTSGRVVDMNSIHFNPPTFEFTLVLPGSVEDVTNQVSITDKKRFSGFDVSAYNDYLYRNRYSESHDGAEAPHVGSTSTLFNFFDQIVHDPLDAPISALETGANKLTNSSGLSSLVLLGAVAVGAYIFFGSRR